MPIREYKCEDCNNYIEVIQGINEEPLKTCPKCGGKLDKLISNSSFILKGSGWYKTDYANSDSKKAKGEQEAKPKDASPTSTACSCKPEISEQKQKKTP